MNKVMATGDRPTVFVIDDDDALREGLTSLFRSIGLQVKAFGSVKDFQQDRTRDAPGCLVLDVRLPGMSGLDLQTELNQTDFQMPIIFISGHADVPMSVRAIKAGAVEFLVKPFREQELLDAVRNGIERDQEQRQKHKLYLELRTRYETLTPREQELFGFVVSGLMNKQIAGEMGISLITVKVHRGNVMQKMRAKSLAELVRMADGLGLARVKAYEKSWFLEAVSLAVVCRCVQSLSHCHARPGHVCHFGCAEPRGLPLRRNSYGSLSCHFWLEESPNGAGHGMIAIVDDDGSVRSAISHLLRSFGYDPLHLSRRKSSCAQALCRTISCVVTDVKMPGMTGVELQHCLIAAGHRLPIIFMTAFPEESVKLRALSAGAHGFLTKPCDPQSLINCVETALQAGIGRNRSESLLAPMQSGSVNLASLGMAD